LRGQEYRTAALTVFFQQLKSNILAAFSIESLFTFS
jgi:hypothetical protein